MGDSLPRTFLNHRAKFDAASFILAGEIRNRINKQKQQPIYPHVAYRHVWITRKQVRKYATGNGTKRPQL